MGTVRQAWTVIADAAAGWIADDAMSLAASIAFYTAFSLAPVVVLVTALAGLVFGREAAQGALMAQLAGLIGVEPARAVQALAASAADPQAGRWAGLLGGLTMIVGATTVFTELQTALNRIWKAAPPAAATLTWLVAARLKGLALIGAIGFLLIVSLAVSAALAALGVGMGRWLPDVAALLWAANTLLSWAVFTVLFALVYRVLPDVRIPWRCLRIGAMVTAFLFLAGKMLIGLYLGTAGIATVYGAAGSFALILLWVYYSAAIFLFGAEITRACSQRSGRPAGGGADPRPAA